MLSREQTKILEGGQGCAMPGKWLRFDQESTDPSPLIPGQRERGREQRAGSSSGCLHLGLFYS